ncbi:MAG: type IV pilus modification protein PilV [Pseudomonadota bacterium]
MKKLHASEGFTLIEVLIAVVIMAFGLLGMGALQLISLKHNQSSLHRNAATLLASQMADNIRVNKSVLDSYQIDVDLAVNRQITIPDCLDTPCTPQQMAEYDLAVWQVDIAESLSTETKVNITINNILLDNGETIRSALIDLSWPERTTKEEAANDIDNVAAQKAEGVAMISHQLEVIP